MLLCSHCGQSVTYEYSYSDQIGLALNNLSQPKSRKEAPAPAAPINKLGDAKVFHALTYLGRSRDYNDLLAFYLLHQVFVCLSRRDRLESWPTLDQMWLKAKNKTEEIAQLAS